MPLPRHGKSAGTKPSWLGRVVAVENAQAEQEESSQTKRSPSSPQGAPKKRSAFGDITNAHKMRPILGRKEAAKGVPKKASKGLAVLGLAKNNEINLKKSLNKILPEDAPAESDHIAKKGASAEEADPSLAPVEQVVPVVPVEDIDKGQLDDPYASAEYAKDIFTYMREREEKFLLPDYMKNQPDITTDMRAILVDWMVEVQENFELTHETLYLAVKLMDHYLVKVTTMRDKLQLIGSTAILIASKFEERCPPCVDDFLYICDDAYKREELLATEVSILQTLHFDINIPIAYRFLRRFAKCAHATMETLTLARFICELTLQEYDFVQESASRLAASCLLLALKMKHLSGWSPTLEWYSGHKAQELPLLVKRLNFLLTYRHDDRLKAVRNKYSHRVFFEVAKMAPIDMLVLEEALQS
ncbi:G2/mitotic-specific cyclin-B3 [Rhineura floridana]|uniref:G2/mitotic-specific cyclin-B3 n=1 Tax=Rhineura floridana TaxID=261503 RepID=UPI002AC89350|nr:G2/mitotic-specific cyclin-B3 [Rhineura floridana]XP_061455064.1 G2/mitotic-specific cyclin-B3 [Rhineura floridana]